MSETTLTGTAYGGTLEACRRQAAEQAAEFFGPDTPVTVVITEATPEGRNYAGEVEVFAAKVARVEALLADAPTLPVHAGGGNLVNHIRAVRADDLRAALDGSET